MTENAPEQKQVALQRLYLKDLSFESPNAPNVFQSSIHPEIKLNVATKSKSIADNQYEVTIEVTLNAKTKDENAAFIVEIEQAGIFLVQGLSEEEKGHALGVWAPNVLFPYLRQTVDSVMISGSLPPLMLAPINFDSLYRQREQK